jgi:hypothetical protein
MHTLVFGAAALAILWLPRPVTAQSATAQSSAAESNASNVRQAVLPDDITRRDLARFDRFLQDHREVADRLRQTPSLIDDPQFLQNHPELSAYLQDHPGVKQEISEHPDTFMRLEDLYARDAAQRDRDAGADRDAMNPNRDRGADQREAADFNRFLDEHREIGEQIRRNPSLCDDRVFLASHPALQTYLQDHPGVREQLRQDPNAFTQQADRDNREWNRDAERRDAMNFDRFLDQHREIAEQIRRDPSLLDNRNFVSSHPVLQAYLQDNPGVREQIMRNPNGFVQQAELDNHDWNQRDHDPAHDRMADFGGFLGSHPDIRHDVSRDASCLRDHQYVQDHAELYAYLNAHPDVRNDLMSNPQDFVHGALQFNNGMNSGAAGFNGRGAGVTGTSTETTTGTAGTSSTPAETTHATTPKQ